MIKKLILTFLAVMLLGSYSCQASSPAMQFLNSSLKPMPITNHDKPGFDKPTLRWSIVPGAVSYEIEFLTKQPENPNSILASKYRVYANRDIFTNGYHADLSWYDDKTLYWRVRAFGHKRVPLGVYSDAVPVTVNHNVAEDLKPTITAVFNENGRPTPLYPAYAWIPVAGASAHEVEVLNAKPKSDDPDSVSSYRIWSKRVEGAFDCYDDEARITPGTYYWRVRGLDDQGQAVGKWSEAGRFVVETYPNGIYAATFGDSITHGGGGISYPPCAWQYSYQTYLDFPAVNLGHSGDTSAAMLERFDRDVLPFKPQYLIILGGSNSLRGGVAAEQVIDELSKIRDKCIANDIRPIFLTLPPINPDAIFGAFGENTVDDWRDEFDAVNYFIKQQPYYIDIAPYLTNSLRKLPLSYAVDGLHPDANAKKIMARVINENWENVTRP